MNKKQTPVKEELPGIRFAEAMLESQRQTEKYIMKLYNDQTSEFRKKIEELRKENLESRSQ